MIKANYRKVASPASISIILAMAMLASPRFTRARPASDAITPLQPFADQVRELERDLDFYGQPLSAEDQAGIDAAFANADPRAAVSRVEKILDKYDLVEVSINPESRVDAKRGPAAADLIQDGARLFLVKVVNQAGVTAPLEVNSPNSGPVYIPSTGNPSPAERLSSADVRERWAEISLLSRALTPAGWDMAPPVQRLSGFPLEYRILMIYSRDAGERSATLAFDVGQGTQDVGFLNEVRILFKIAPAHSIALHVYDENGQRTMASFVFEDAQNRIYPNPSKRLAPDFYFQPQVYRYDGESVSLPPGSYTVTYTGGPEYITETNHFTVNAAGPKALTFHLKRWIDPTKFGWYSGDDHIHPAGCSHYENPTQGVLPTDMDRQVLGEHLNVGATLIWGPCFYYQSQFFRGRQNNPVSRPYCLMHYDLEVSGFPSSHCGHLVLLNLKNLMYPGTKRIEDWPTWDLPVLRWARSQGAAAGFAHSGWGLKVAGSALPNYQIPSFDSIGANEYIVDVTYPNTVDFISAGDTPYVWELNIWYQTLNVGFRTRLSGETDFPCIYDSRVGEGRTYAKIDGPLTYDKYVKAVEDGAVYVSDGRSHLMDFTVNGTQMGTRGSEVDLAAPATVQVSVNAAAYLDLIPRSSAPAHYDFTQAAASSGQSIQSRPYDEKPYWDLDRCRIGDTRKVAVELLVNGEPVAKRDIVADGTVQKLNFNVAIKKSSWMAVRILPSSHTNPIFVIVGGRPIRASRRSAEWCLAGVNQCWTQKSPLISSTELPAARQAYDHARQVYQKLISECGE
ncbi:MAG TPA: CehA/McbA family metallohydrolase [Terriglobia bacterium]|nr:CehA/McbA family metallohydrolase [Terriglobia bacterium]